MEEEIKQLSIPEKSLDTQSPTSTPEVFIRPNGHHIVAFDVMDRYGTHKVIGGSTSEKSTTVEKKLTQDEQNAVLITQLAVSLGPLSQLATTEEGRQEIKLLTDKLTEAIQRHAPSTRTPLPTNDLVAKASSKLSFSQMTGEKISPDSEDLFKISKPDADEVIQAIKKGELSDKDIIGENGNARSAQEILAIHNKKKEASAPPPPQATLENSAQQATSEAAPEFSEVESMAARYTADNIQSIDEIIDFGNVRTIKYTDRDKYSRSDTTSLTSDELEVLKSKFPPKTPVVEQAAAQPAAVEPPKEQEASQKPDSQPEEAIAELSSVQQDKAEIPEDSTSTNDADHDEILDALAWSLSTRAPQKDASGNIITRATILDAIDRGLLDRKELKGMTGDQIVEHYKTTLQPATSVQASPSPTGQAPVESTTQSELETSARLASINDYLAQLPPEIDDVVREEIRNAIIARRVTDANFKDAEGKWITDPDKIKDILLLSTTIRGNTLKDIPPRNAYTRQAPVVYTKAEPSAPVGPATQEEELQEEAPMDVQTQLATIEDETIRNEIDGYIKGRLVTEGELEGKTGNELVELWNTTLKTRAESRRENPLKTADQEAERIRLLKESPYTPIPKESSVSDQAAAENPQSNEDPESPKPLSAKFVEYMASSDLVDVALQRDLYWGYLSGQITITDNKGNFLPRETIIANWNNRQGNIETKPPLNPAEIRDRLAKKLEISGLDISYKDLLLTDVAAGKFKVTDENGILLSIRDIEEAWADFRGKKIRKNLTPEALEQMAQATEQRALKPATVTPEQKQSWIRKQLQKLRITK